jgi:quinol monooxygenase YgiN
MSFFKMKGRLQVSVWVLILVTALSCQRNNTNGTSGSNEQIILRIAEVEIEPKFLKQYLDILKEESEASVRLEPGVICIFPMYQKENPTQIRLLEIYANKEAYESHLQSPHFKHYKTSTLPMVKSLRLVDMEAIDPGSMPMLFAKFR